MNTVGRRLSVYCARVTIIQEAYENCTDEIFDAQGEGNWRGWVGEQHLSAWALDTYLCISKGQCHWRSKKNVLRLTKIQIARSVRRCEGVAAPGQKAGGDTVVGRRSII